ncbi:MAG: MFS transporter [Clostridia bacterium]|nr:MFS transporter [Clostridia bacterium]
MDTNKKGILTFYTLSAFYWFAFYSFGSTLATHAESLGLSESVIGLIVGSYGLAQVIFRIPVGILSDSFNKRRIFIGLGLFLCAVSCFGLGQAQGATGLLLFRTLSGVAVASYVVFPSYATNTLGGKDLHKVTGMLSALGQTGRVIALMAGSLLAMLVGSVWSFYVGAIAAVIGLILWFWIPRDPVRETKEKVSVKHLFSVIRDRNLLISSLLTIILQFNVFATIYSFIPIYARSLHMNDFSIGLLTASFTLSGIVSAILGFSVFKKKFGVRNTITASFILSGIVILLFPYTENITLLFVLQLLNGFFMGLLLPMLMAQALKTVNPERSAAAMGFYQAIYGIGMFSGPFIVGVIIENGNIKNGFFAVFIISIIGALATYIYKRSDMKNGLA